MKRFLLSALLWAACSAGAFADGTIDVGSPSSGSGWTWSSPTVTITASGSYTITGATTANRVAVASGVTASITLSGVSIDVSGAADACAFSVATTARVTLLLSGSNTLKSNGRAAGLQAPAGATLTITSSAGDGATAGTLSAYGGLGTGQYSGAGIGGGEAQSGGTIEIRGGTVNAIGSYYAAGIGGGYGDGGGGGGGGSITVTSGTVTATGGRYAAGIGGGYYGSGGTIRINGGTVTATSGNGAAGIGGGYYGSGGTIRINGGTVTALSTYLGAGIGGGYYGSGGAITITDGIVTAFTSGGNGDPAAIGGAYGSGAGAITITGGTVAALAGSGGAIGGGASNTDGSINISGGTIIATGAGVGIGADNGSTATAITGNPIIFATAINGKPSAPASGIATGGDIDIDIDIANSTITLNTDFTVPSSAVLTIPPGWTLSCNSHSLTNSGAIIKLGTVSGECISSQTYTEFTHMNGHGAPQHVANVVSGSKAVRPYPDPSAAGYIFDGWYRESSCQTAWRFGADVVTSDTNLYARWTEIISSSTIDVGSPTHNPDGGWTWISPTVTITASGTYVIVGATTANRVVVDSGVTASITLYGVSIDVSGAADACAFSVTPTANVTLLLAGANTLKSNGDAAGLQAPEGATLTITSSAGDGATFGTLDTYGGLGTGQHSGAGIGGGEAQSGGAIEIRGGTVSAYGFYAGAGIGGGKGGMGGTITIHGGTVAATGGDYGAGIGGGYYGSGGTIRINGGTVTATGGYYAAGIGGGIAGGGGSITVTGSTVNATGGYYAAGIGGGIYGGGGSITVTGGTVNATGDFAGAGIGGGKYGTGGTITIHGGTVNATGGYYAAGIGGGYYGGGGSITVTSGTVNAYGGSEAAGIGGGYDGGGGSITVTSGTVNAIGGGYAAGIGGGSNGSGGTIRINGGTVTASSAGMGAGIGGGFGASGGDITITGGIITASTSGGNGDPAAIGGASNSGAGAITITGGTVVALAGTAGGAFGGGAYNTDGSINISGGTIIATGAGVGIGARNGSTATAITGNPIIFATAINSNPSAPESGVATGDDVGIANSTITLNTDFTVPSSAVLTIPPGWTLSCNGHSLTNSGAIINHGTVSGSCVSTQLYTEFTHMNGHVAAQHVVNVVSGSQAVMPYPDPSATGYTFGGWYKESSCQNAWSFGADVDVVTRDIDLYAKWTGNTYAVTLDPQGGSGGASPVTATYGSDMPAATAPTRTGYTFEGYYDAASGGTQYYTSNMLSARSWDKASADTLYAQWTANTYTVILDPQSGGGGASSVTATYGSDMPAATAPTRAGYTFEGYYDAASEGTQYYAASMASARSARSARSAANMASARSWDKASNATLYARWTANTYTVAYDGNGSTSGSMASSVHTYDVAKNLTSNDYTKTGYTFAGWASTSGGDVAYVDGASVTNLTAIAGDTVTLYAQWTTDTTAITLSARYSGGADGSVTATYNAALPPFTALTRTGYTLTGYFTSSTGDTKVINAGGTLASGVSGYTNADGRWVRHPNTALTLYAQWTANTYTVAYDGNCSTSGSTASSTHTYDAVGSLTVNGYVKAGYTFAGWAPTPGGGAAYGNAALVVNLTATAADTVTLYAQWTANTTAISLSASYSGGVNGSVTAEYGAALPPFAAATRAGYTLTGYFTEATGGTMVINANGTLASGVSGYTSEDGKWVRHPNTALVLHAQWAANTTAIALDRNGGGADGSVAATYDTALSSYVAVGQRTGYTLTGYCFTADADENAVRVIGAGGALTPNLIDYSDAAGRWIYTGPSPLTLYAQWRANAYTVTLDAQSGSVTPSSKTVTYDSALGALPTPVRASYTFGGWYTAAGGGGSRYEPSTTYRTAGDTTLYAQWTAIEYSITYALNGGLNSPDSVACYTVEDTTITLRSPGRIGYTFAGWYADAGFAGGRVDTIAHGSAGDTTLYAKWTANTTEVTLDKNGGGADGSVTATYDADTLSSFPPVARLGYTLTGYFTEATGGAMVIDAGGTLASGVGRYTSASGQWIYTASAALTLYAQWTANTCTVAYDGNGSTGGSTASSTHTYGVAGSLTANGYDKAGYTFAGWALTPGGGAAYGNAALVVNLTATAADTVTLYAQWTANTTAIALSANYSGGVNGSVTAEYGAALPPFAAATRAGYTLTGYFTEATSGEKVVDAGGTLASGVSGYTSEDGKWVRHPNTALVLHAQWAANTTAIALDRNGGGADGSVAATYDAALSSYVAVGQRTGYTLTGYCFTADADENAVRVIGAGGALTPNLIGYTSADGRWMYTGTSPLTLYAKWTANTYTVALDRNGGGADGSVAAAYDTALPPFTPVARTGYTLTGYFTEATGGEMVIDAGGTLAASTPGYADASGRWIKTTDATLYAQWAANSYTVTLDAQSGSVTPSSKPVTYDSAVGELPTPARASYTFGGWYTAAGGGGSRYEPSTTYRTAGDTTLYAQWAAVSYTVAYDGNGSTGGSTPNSTHTYGVEGKLTANGYAKAGYTFAGWAATPGGSAAYGDEATVANLTTAAGDTVTLYAQWTAGTTAIALSASYSGGASGSVTATYGAALPAFTALTRAGYTLTGYFTEATGGEKVIDAGGALASDVSGYTGADGQWVRHPNTALTLHAHWAADTTAIALSANCSGSADGSVAATYGAALSSYTAPVRAGYTLTGYYFTADADENAVRVIGAGGALTPNLIGYTSADGRWMYTGTSPLTLYAKWTANTYTVALDRNGGGADGSVTATYGAALPPFTPVGPRTGYTLRGYFTAATGGEMVIDAGGALAASTPGYTDASGSWIKATDVTLYAQWAAVTYAVAYDGNGSTAGYTAGSTHTYDVEGSLTANGYAKAGYSFAGWAATPGGSAAYGDKAPVANLTATAAATVTLYAKWTANTTAIALSASYSGGASTSVTATYGAALPTFTALTRAGYSLKGYYFSADADESAVRVIGAGGALTPNLIDYTNAASKWTYTDTSPLTLYAQWTANTYTVTLDKNGGGADGSVTATYGAALPTFTPVARTGYTLTGYFTEATGGAKVIDAGGTLASGVGSYTSEAGQWVYTASTALTLHAQWAAVTYAVAYDGNGSTAGSTTGSTHTYDVAGSLTANGFTKAGHIFAGWATTPGGSAAYGNAASVANLTATAADTVTLYAAWSEPAIASLTLISSDGDVLKRWERKDITEDTVFYELPCRQSSGDVWVRCEFPPGVRGSYAVAVAPLAGEAKTVAENRSYTDSITLWVPVDSLARTLISVSLENSARKPYIAVLSKRLGLFDVITEHLSGCLRVVNNDPAANRTGLQFSACKWWRKRDTDAQWRTVEESRLYYAAGPSLSDRFTERDSMYLALTLLNGETLVTCPDANSVAPGESGSGGSAGKKSSRIAVYPNPVASGGFIKLKLSGSADGEEEEEEERYVKYSLFGSQGSLILTGEASPLYEGQGLAMPFVPAGIYHLLLEGKSGKRWVAKVAVEK